MRNALIVGFTASLGLMLAMTVRASLNCSILEVPEVVLNDFWFHATLTDAYLGFLTFFAWVCYRESNVAARILWFVLIMLLGNMAMAAYVLIKLVRLPKDANAASLLLRPEHLNRSKFTP